MLAIALLAGCGGITRPTDLPVAENATGIALNGTWRVRAAGEGPGTLLDLHGGDLTVVRDCDVTEFFQARGGLFLSSGGHGWSTARSCPDDKTAPVPWLRAAARYARAGDGWQLLDHSGGVVALLQPGGQRPTQSPSKGLLLLGDDLTPEQRAAQNAVPAAPVPDGYRPATEADLVGRWVAANSRDYGCSSGTVTFQTDGTWGPDGGGPLDGRWVLGADGLALAAPAGTVVECNPDSIYKSDPDIDNWMARVARIGVFKHEVVLFDALATELGRLVPADSVRSSD